MAPNAETLRQSALSVVGVERDAVSALAARIDDDFVRAWQVGADQILVLFRMSAQHRKRVVVPCLNNAFEVAVKVRVLHS